MKRDMELVRKILLAVESRNDGHSFVYEYSAPSEADSAPSEAEWHHVNLLIKARLLNEVGTTRSNDRRKVHLTWEGHDYLDAVRDEGIWAKTKAAVAETGGSATLEIMKSLAIGLLKKKISQHTGLEL